MSASTPNGPPPPTFNLRSIGPEPSGAIPLEQEDLDGLIPEFIATRADLNHVEFENIAKALPWARRQARVLGPERILEYPFMLALHRRMFGDVWTWAGRQRRRTHQHRGGTVLDCHPVQASVRRRQALARSRSLRSRHARHHDPLPPREHLPVPERQRPLHPHDGRPVPRLDRRRAVRVGRREPRRGRLRPVHLHRGAHQGSGFAEATAVKFGTARAASFKVLSDSEVQAVSPGGAGTVDVSVETPAGVSSTSQAPDQFNYAPLVNSGSGVPATTGVASLSVRTRPLTRAQRLAKALRACKRKPRRKRATCERQARRRYAPPKRHATR